MKMENGNRAGSYSDRGGGRRNQDVNEAISIFRHIKELYAKKIDELNELKRQVFLIQASDGAGQYILDHQQRSKLRIAIESLLIDLNEEIFGLSEELAKSFASGDRQMSE